MMNANELRIGNLIEAKAFEIWIPCKIENGADIQSILINPDLNRGIKLSEKWLTDNGFTRVKPRIGVAASFTLKFINTVRLNLSNSGNLYYGQKFIGSVHEVQNLVFALTGRELITSQ